ncbi:class I SAM-dependent methyltransferase [Armatimonas sp.]|uniref:class I SAM-dependent methyltransferase n=1 Tax=Armatimonas sp. TaxID=1872638 RepID=UPI003750FB31
MRRLHFIELTDLPGWPTVFRDGATDYLETVVRLANPYAKIVPKLAAALEACQATNVLDLCSGAGGPWATLLPLLEGQKPDVLLTDFYPNLAGSALPYHIEPVDATKVPEALAGFRTLFASFHHFRPEQARAILADAVEKRQGIAVFEATARTIPALLGMLFVPLAVWIITPRIRPVRFSRLFFTYLIPILPFAVFFDGFVSCLRTYTPDELRELTAGLDQSYTWEIGSEPVAHSPMPITYLIGLPKEGTLRA